MDPNPTSQNQPEIPVQVPTPMPQFQPGSPMVSPARNNGSGFAIVALVLGIIAFLFGWIGFINFVIGFFNVLTAIAAVAFGIIAMVKHQTKGVALTGLILGGIGLIASIIFCIIGYMLIQDPINKANDAMKNFDADYYTSHGGYTLDKPTKSTWDYVAAYEKLQTGMSKAQVEAALGKKATSCSDGGNEGSGHIETCTYGEYTGPGMVNATFEGDKLVYKSKYANSTN